MLRNQVLVVWAGLAMLGTFLAIPVSAADADWKVGDFWEYAWNESDEGLQFIGTIKMEVAGTTSVTIGSQSEKAFVLDISGHGNMSGVIETMTVTGTVTVSGTETRLASNLSFVGYNLIMSVSVSAPGLTMSMDMGMEATATPPMMDLPANENLTLSASFVSHSVMTETSWTNILGSNQTDTQTSDITTTLTVAQTDVSIDTDAGTFACTKLSASTGDANVTFYYYSPKVGNYVKILGEGGSAGTGFGAFGGLTLTDYSYGSSGGGIVSYFTGKNAWVTVVIIVALVLLIALVVAMRGRRAPVAMPPPAGTPTPPPPGQEMPPPPPPTS